MEKVNYIAFFKEVEFIQRGEISFPSFRAPFYEFPEPCADEFVILVAVEGIDTSTKTIFSVQVFDPQGTMQHTTTLNGFRNRREKQFIICEIYSMWMDQSGEYKVKVFSNEILIGESSFTVLDEERKGNE